MIATLFIHAISDLLTQDKAIIKNHLNDLNQLKDSFMQFVLKDTQKNCFDFHTVEDALLYAYYVFLVDYSIFKESFDKIMFCGLENHKDESANHVFSIFTSNRQYQNIDYKIVNLEGTLTSVYTIKNSISLLAFELAHISEVDPMIIKCKNCGHYFVSKRIDAIYCSYSYKNTNKTCKEIGAQQTRKQKEKEDEFTREYRKQYMRLQMKYKRHHYDSKYKDALIGMVSGGKEIREKVKENKISEKEWKEWLEKFHI